MNFRMHTEASVLICYLQVQTQINIQIVYLMVFHKKTYVMLFYTQDLLKNCRINLDIRCGKACYWLKSFKRIEFEDKHGIVLQ